MEMDNNKSLETGNQKATSDVLMNVIDSNTADNITLYELKVALHERGFGLLLVLFSLPLSIPMPVPPGLTTIMSVPLFLFAVQMILGFDSPWLPQWLAKKSIKRTTLALVIEKSSPYLKRVEKLLRPRFTFASSKTGEKFLGLCVFLCSLSIAIPLPLTNFIPALGILIMSLGFLSKDGLMIAFGIIVGAFGIFVASLVVIFGQKLVVKLIPWIKNIA